MSGNHEALIELCAGYAIGGLDEADRARMEEHLARGCAECEAALADFSVGAVLLAAAAPPALPSPRLKERVLAAAHAEQTRAELAAAEAPQLVRARPPHERRRAPRRFIAAAIYGWAAAASLALGVFVFARATWRLRGELAIVREEVAGLEQRLEAEARWMQVLSAPSARVAVLAATPAGNADLRARATLDPATRRAVVVFDNLQAPSGRDYELWAIRGASPASLGVIKADESGRAVMRIDDVGDPATLNAFAVSLEPAGGSPTPTAPTGPVVMLGAMGG